MSDPVDREIADHCRVFQKLEGVGRQRGCDGCEAGEAECWGHYCATVLAPKYGIRPHWNPQLWERAENSVIELNVVDPDSQAGDNDGIYLEIVKLDDHESVVRDRWPNQGGDRHIVSTSDIYSIYRALVDQVEEVT